MRVYNYNFHPQDGAKKRAKKPKMKRWLTWIFRLAAVFVFFCAALFLYYTKDLPDPNKLLNRMVAESTKIYDREGGMLYEIHGEEKRTLVQLDQINDNVKNATIAVEDKDFYKHGAISITGILRSALRYVVNMGPSGGGGSTITQQFVKNAILTKKQTFDRKIREAILSMTIEARFSKDEILKLYLNEIPYGRNAYGVEAAAQSYFGKSANDLDLAQSAYLAALPQAPSYYNPQGANPQALDNRKNLVLRLMREQGYIDEQQEKLAKQEKVEFLKTNTAFTAPHFVMMIQDYLNNKYGEKTLQEGGLKVYTTLDPNLQKIAETAISDHAETNAKKYNAYNEGLVAIDPKTGQILAMVGSKNYDADPEPKGCTPGKTCLFEPYVNVALSPRQPGSSFKPYVYTTAFTEKYKFNPASMIMDIITNFGKYGNTDYVPKDYDGGERGPVSIRKAFAGSLNIPAVKVLDLVGVENAVQTARNLGITSPLSDCGLSLVLGGCEVKLVDHVAAFSVIANGGVKNEKTSILKILDKNNNILEEYKESPKEVVDPRAVFQTVSIMTDNNARSYIFGPNSALVVPGHTVAVKTGTTQRWHDGWTLGFTPSLAAGVWVGNNDGELLKTGADGSYIAAPIWNQFMKEALKDKPDEPFTQPSGIIKMVVDKVSGKLPTQYTVSTKEEIFADYNVPTDYDNVNVSVALDTLTGQPADAQTPPGQIINKNYTVFHSEKPNNPDWENPVVAWAVSKGYAYPPGGSTYITPGGGSGEGPTLAIIKPEDGEIISVPFTVSVSAISPNFVSKVELFIDGRSIGAKNSQPFEFSVNGNFPDGSHLIAVKATDSLGNTSDTSANVIFGSNVPFTITDPPTDSLIIFPLSLVAQSGRAYDEVSFYYESSEDSSSHFIGTADTYSAYGKYQYTYNWSTKLPAGLYKVYAKNNLGELTDKITISVP